jgi:hypothetical protein
MSEPNEKWADPHGPDFVSYSERDLAKVRVEEAKWWSLRLAQSDFNDCFFMEEARLRMKAATDALNNLPAADVTPGLAAVPSQASEKKEGE